MSETTERTELLKVARNPKAFSEAQWMEMRARWRVQLAAEAAKVRESKSHPAASLGRKKGTPGKPMARDGYLVGFGKHAYGSKARYEAIRELFQP